MIPKGLWTVMCTNKDMYAYRYYVHQGMLTIKRCPEPEFNTVSLSLYQPSLSSKKKLLSKGNKKKKNTTLLRDQQTSVAGVGDDGNSHYLSHIHECA